MNEENYEQQATDQVSEKSKEKAHKIYNEFTNATAFLDQLKLRKDITRCVNFEAGRQWNMDEDVKDFPKITLNVIKQIGKLRKSNVLQNDYGFLVNSTHESDIRKVQDFLKFLHEKLRLKKKDLQALNDTYTKGTAVCYFYWDAHRRDFLSKSGGKLRADIIDIRRFRVADPYIIDVQDQEYVIYDTLETIESIKDKYGVTPTPDDTNPASETEPSQAPTKYKKTMVNVYTKFYRNEDGQVHFIISTAHEILKDATPLNPYYDLNKKEEASASMRTMDEKTEEKIKEEVFDLYPFATLVLDERDNCFYGIPGALEYLEAQKSINHHFSVYDKGLQDNVLGGFAMRRGILGDEEISTDNGQVLNLDLRPGESIQDVFGRIPVNNIPSEALNYSGSLMGVLRDTAGASNIQIGKSDYSGQSGKQTELLLQRAKENSNDVALRFNEYKKDQAKIMFLFAKFYYDNESFSIVEHGFQEDNVHKYVDKNKFDGRKLLGRDIMIDIRVGPAPAFSEYSSIELLGMMVQSGQAPLEVYLSNLPEGYVNNKEELANLLKNNSQKAIEKLTKQLDQAHKVMEQMSKAYDQVQKDMKNIDTVINENQRLKSMMAELAAKGVEISRDANKTKSQMMKEMNDLLKIARNQGRQNNTNVSPPETGSNRNQNA